MTSRGANLYGLDEEMQVKKMKIGQWLSLGVFALYTFLGALILNYNNTLLPLILFVVCGLFGPVTLIFYLIEVKKGVFRVTEEELLEMEAEARKK
jgi:hypothetical protein